MDNKRKQHRFIWIAGMAASACLLAACGTSQKGQITVEPSGLTANSAAANTRAAALIADGRNADAVRILRQHQSVPEARYNLGLLLAAQGETDEAYRLLLPFADLNAAILALQVGEREKAKEILGGLDDNVSEVRELKQIMNYK